MEPFRIIPTRRWLRSSRKAQEVNEKGDQLGVLGAKPKAASPHPDPSILAKEMEEFEKLMHLGSTEEAGSDTTDTKKSEKEGETKQAVEQNSYVPDQPTTSSLEPYEPAQPTTSPIIPLKGGQTAKAPEAYEPDQPTPMDEVYTPDQPTLAVDGKAARVCPLQNSEPYEPEQPTDEPMLLEDSAIIAKAKTEISEVEADMPQLLLDSGGSGNCEQIEKGGDHTASENIDAAPSENVSNNERGNKSEQENLLPEVWLRKKEKKKKHSHHGKHKKPLVEWRLGVLRKDYVIKDFKSFPVDEKLMATTKHKWNDDSEVEHLKYLQSGDGSQTDTSEVSGMTSPAIAPSDSELESEQNTSGDIDCVGRICEGNVRDSDGGIHGSNDIDNQRTESNRLEGKTKDEEPMEVDMLQEEIDLKKSDKPGSGLEDRQPAEGDAKKDGSSTIEKTEDLGVQKDGDKSEAQKQSSNKEETKAKSEREEENSTRMSTRQSSRRARRDSGENKTDANKKTDKKDDDYSRRRSRRSEICRDDSDDEKRKESDKNRGESDRSGSDTRRRSQRRDRHRDDSDDERRDENREGRRRGRSDSRERRGRSDSRERRRYRDDDDRYDRYDRGRRPRRSERRSLERTDDRRSREDDRRNERNDSRERDDRRRKGKVEKESKKDTDQTQTKEESKSNDEKKVEKSNVKEGGKLPEKNKTDTKATDSDNVQEKDQNSKPNTSTKTTGRVPIKFNFTSRAVRRSTRSAVKAKGGVFDDEGDDEDERPLSELQNSCDEKEPIASSSESSADHAPVTRSKSKEGCPIKEPLEENSVTQLSSVHAEGSIPSRGCSSHKRENLFDNALKKEFKRDQESESDSGAELSLMGLGDAPSLYPENILESQVEMELLASAFSSTDTEAETDIEKVLDKAGGGDNIVKEGKYSPKQEVDPVVCKSNAAAIEVEEQQHDASSKIDFLPSHLPDEHNTEMDVNAKLSKSTSPTKNSRTFPEEMRIAPEEQSHVEIDQNEKMSQIESPQENRGISIDETLTVPEAKTVPHDDEIHEVYNESVEGDKEEKELDTNTSLDTEPSDVESFSLPKISSLRESEDDFPKTESESEDALSMEVIDLMAGTTYKTSKISVVLPTEISDVNQEVPEMIIDNDKTNVEQTSRIKVQEEVTAVSQPPQQPISDFQVCDVNSGTTVLDHSTTDQNITVQEAYKDDLSLKEGSLEAACDDEMVLPSIEIVNESLPSQKDIDEVLHKESAVIHNETVDTNPIESSEIQTTKNDATTSQVVPPVSTESTETSSTCEPFIAVDEQPTKHVVQEGPVVSKRKRKSRWEAFVPDIPAQPPTLNQIDVIGVGTQQEDPSMVNIATDPTFQPRTEETHVKDPGDELKASEEIQPVPVKETFKMIFEEQSSSRLEVLDDENSVDSPKADEEVSSPSKRVRIDPDVPNVGTTDHISQDISTPTITLGTGVFGKTEAITQSSGAYMEVNGAGDNQAMVKLEGMDRNREAGIKEEAKDGEDFLKPEPVAGEDSVEEGELIAEVKEETDEKTWDESTGMEQGEIEDDGEEEGEDWKKERRSRHSRQEKENVPQDEYWAGEGKKEDRDRPKEETRESREERRRKQYEEWGMVERSKMPRFVELTENYYLTERRRSKAGKEARRMVCCCATSREERRRGIQACGEDCLNRVLMLECGSRCPCGDYCTNRRFQKKEYARVGVFYAEGKGHGLKAKEELKENEFVMEYIGEVLNFPEFKHRAKQYSKDKNLHFYFMALKSDEIIDATEKGNVSRFMNHSCDPNCETQKWTVNGQLRVGFFTKRLVQPGEELTFDYQFEVYGQEAQKCLCGSEKCRGVIGKQKKQKEGKDTTPRRRGSVGEKRRKEAFTDVTLEDEIQQMVDELDECGLQSNDHTIALSRFMVRADQPKQRLSLLKLLQETTEQSYLKYFLTHHGLKLIWSWMVDLGDNPAELQMQILRTLATLPIPNKNALEDSKVLSVIERWAKDFAKQGVPQETTSANKTDSDVDSSSASETPSRSDTPISAAMASSLNINSSIEKLKSIAEATSSESDMDSETPSGVSLPLRLRLEAESTESPTSTASEEGESNEKPTSSAGEDSQNEQPEEELLGQPDSASDAATSSSTVGESVSKDIKAEASEENASSETLALESDVVDSTEAGLQETKEESSDDNSKEIRTLKSLAADATEQVQSQDSSADVQTDLATSQSEDVVSESSAPLAESVTESTSESENRTTNVEQPSSVAAETDNEAESKTDEGEKGGSSELASIISSLLSSWSDLKEIYRIPKKESEKDRDKDRNKDRHRDHDRDRDRRHDRDRDYDRDRHRDRDHGRDRDRGRDRDDRHHRDRSRDGDRDRHRDRDRKDRDKSDDKSRRKRSRSRSRERETKSSWSKDSEANATPPKLRKPWKETKGKEGKGVVKEDVKIEKETKKMSKEERRHLFEMQVEAKEREDAARKEQEALMMAQWQESEQQRQQQQMAQYIDVNGFPVDPNAQGMMVNEHGMPVNEHGMPIEVIPGHMGGMPMGEQYMGHPDMPHPDMTFPPEHMHPDMHGQFPEHMQQHEHMGMEEGYHGPPMHEHHMMSHVEGQPMYDDSGFPIPPQEHMPPGMMGMPPSHEGMPHPAMDYQMHPDMDPHAMGHTHVEHPNMDSHMMGVPPHANMDVHLIGGQPHPGDPNMYPAEHHMMQPPMEALPVQEMHVPQVVPIPAAGAAQVPSQPAPREEDLMPPPTLPAPSRKSKKSKSQKSSAKPTKTSPPSTTYVAPAAPASSASPVLPSALPSSSVAGVNAQGYPAQAAQGVVPVAQAPQVLQTPVLPQAPQQAAQTTFTFVTPDGMLVTQTIVPLAATDQGISPHVQPMQQHQQMAGVQQQQQPQVTESIPSPPAKPKTAKLPPNWKTAQDSEGKIYYYHSVTRQTQWEMPTWDEEGGDAYDDEAGGGSNTPTYDEKGRQKTTTAPADTSSEAAKRLKEAFRSKMSHHVVGYLNAYRKPDCKLGRITNTEDFKHLARKLTHGIMAKELKHCRNIEDLEVNENVKHKAKEYIKKYMGRYGKLYKKDPAESDI